MPDLSVLIAARCEMWLSRTVEDVLAHAKGDTEVIVVLDGAWADPPLRDHPCVRIIYRPESIGQRAAVNLAARVSRARYVMKLDAHCSVDEGFDVKLMQADEELGRPDVTQIPAMYNLHIFNWRCQGCGTESYQGPTPTLCATCGAKGTTGGPFERVVYWDLKAGGVPGKPMRTEFWRFDHTLHFFYWNEYRRRPEAKGDLVDVMSAIGCCFFMRRSRFWEIGGLDEAAGSWGQFGQEIACKSWLSGGRHVVNKRTWIAHAFRTQGGDWSFPYPLSGQQVDRARKHSQDMWYENKWPGQALPLSWLVDKFWPIPGWDDSAGAERLRLVRSRGAMFALPSGCTRNDNVAMGEVISMPLLSVADHAATRLAINLVGQGVSGGTVRHASLHGADTAAAHHISGLTDKCEMRGIATGGPVTSNMIQHRNVAAPPAIGKGTHEPSEHQPMAVHHAAPVGIVYYSDMRGDARMLQAVRDQLRRAAPDLPIVSVTLRPLDFGRNIALPLERSYLSMFKQILAGLEALDTDVAFLCEHDVVYSPLHFQFTPPTRDRYYYNINRWQVDATTGRAVHYRCCQTSGLCADRQLLIAHYRTRVELVERDGFSRNLGFEPGTNSRSRAIDGVGFETWFSAVPNIDIRHGHNLTATRWSAEQFRNKNSCQGWTEADTIPGWGRTRGRFDQFLADLGRQAQTEGVA